MSPIMTCPQFIEGCPDCEAEAEYQTSQGRHLDCSDEVREYPYVTSFCVLQGQWRREDEDRHRRSHEPERCNECNVILDDHRGNDRLLSRNCYMGYCQQFYCPDCLSTHCSMGPVGCPACSPWRPAKLNRMRQMYRARRRGRW